MPVSKKRKKDGKPVHRATPVAAGEEHAHGPDAKPEGLVRQAAKPSNPFVAHQTRRASQRGR
ncbi:MAG: hypothetical protein QM704_14750 [Anaeromyxobacteraceae bacterium]